MICCQWWIIQTPPSQIIPVPTRYRHMRSNLHPMSLRFKITIHWRFQTSYYIKSQYSLPSSHICRLPETPQKPSAHRNNAPMSKTIEMDTHEGTSFAGAKNATNGKAGCTSFEFTSCIKIASSTSAATDTVE